MLGCEETLREGRGGTVRLRIQILADQALPHVNHDVAVLAGPHKVLQGLRYNRVIIAEPLFLVKSKRRFKKNNFMNILF